MVIAALALACGPSARALDPSLEISQYAHTSWKVRDGFLRGMVNELAQGSDGYVWLGTEHGVLRFDGVRFVAWQPPAGQQLPSNFIQGLLFARDGTLWIGTSSGLASLKAGKLTTYSQMTGQNVARLLQDRDGTIWAGGIRTPNEAKLCSVRSGSVDCQGGDGSLGDGVYGLYEDTQENLWVGVAHGFWRWKPDPPRLARPTSFDSLQRKADYSAKWSL